MATIDDQWLVHQVDAADATVLQAHHAVRVARLMHCRHGRARPHHRSRRARWPHVSQYRPAGIADASAQPPTTLSGTERGLRTLPTVGIAVVALSLLYVVFIRVFDPGLNDKALVLGVYLIAVTAAVCLNAFTLDALAPPAGGPSGSYVSAAPTQSAGASRDSEPDNSKEQR